MALSLDDPVDAVDGVGTTGGTGVGGRARHRHRAGPGRALPPPAPGPRRADRTSTAWSSANRRRWWARSRRGRPSHRPAAASDACRSPRPRSARIAAASSRPRSSTSRGARRQLPSGTVVAFSGEVKRFRGQLKLTLAGGDQRWGAVSRRWRARRTSSTVSCCRSTRPPSALPTWKLAQWVEAALEDLPAFDDYLDEDVLDHHDLLDLDTATRAIHLPEDRPTFDAARKRLAFDELFTLQLGLQWRRTRLESELAGHGQPPARRRPGRPVPGRPALRPDRGAAPGLRAGRRGPRLPTGPCTGCCRATSAPARPSWRSGRCCAPSTRGGRPP